MTCLEMNFRWPPVEDLLNFTLALAVFSSTCAFWLLRLFAMLCVVLKTYVFPEGITYACDFFREQHKFAESYAANTSTEVAGWHEGKCLGSLSELVSSSSAALGLLCHKRHSTAHSAAHAAVPYALLSALTPAATHLLLKASTLGLTTKQLLVNDTVCLYLNLAARLLIYSHMP